MKKIKKMTRDVIGALLTVTWAGGTACLTGLSGLVRYLEAKSKEKRLEGIQSSLKNAERLVAAFTAARTRQK